MGRAHPHHPGLLFLILAPLQFIPRIRSRHLGFHRGLGRVLVVCAAISGVFALVAAFRLPAFGGISTQAATVFFGVIFLFAIAKGFLHIRRRQIRQHREWMIRVMALAMGVATIRLFIALFTAAFDLGFEEVFGTSFWLGLGLNLLVAEVWINHTRVGLRLRQRVPADPAHPPRQRRQRGGAHGRRQARGADRRK